jgi:hypothetical protein
MADSARTFTVRRLEMPVGTCAGLFCRRASKVPTIPSEDNKMKRLLILSALVLSTTMIGPVAARAGAPQEKRYYDKSGKDYHTWNDNEDHAYRTYLTEQHRDYRDFNKVNKGQQQEYFKWRHQHPDNALVKVEIK